MENDILMQLIDKIDEVKDKVSQVDTKVEVLSTKSEERHLQNEARFTQIEKTLESNSSKKSNLVELLESTNGKWIIWGSVAILVLLVGVMFPSVFPFIGHLVASVGTQASNLPTVPADSLR